MVEMADYRIDFSSVNNPSAPDLDTVIEALQNAVLGGGSGGDPNVVYVESYTGTASQKIQAAIDFAATNAQKTVVLADKDYYISSTITVKVGVRLMGGHASSITIGANVRGIVVERNAVLENLKINIDYSGYSQQAIYLDGIQKFYNSLNRARLYNLVLYNWTGVTSGTAIHLYSGGTSHEISFVDFDTIKNSWIRQRYPFESSTASIRYGMD
jgi:hypothetical protein